MRTSACHQTSPACSRCHKETAQNRLLRKYNRLLCEDCAGQVPALYTQLAAVDKRVDDYISLHNLHPSTAVVRNIKQRITAFLTEYIQNTRSYYVFYWSEYPMGAIHNKLLIKNDAVWCVVQYDYDKNPSEKTTPYPEINDDNLTEYLLQLSLSEI